MLGTILADGLTGDSTTITWPDVLVILIIVFAPVVGIWLASRKDGD